MIDLINSPVKLYSNLFKTYPVQNVFPRVFMHQHASFLHSDPNCSNLHGRVRDWGVAWWSAMHYELRLGETQSLNNEPSNGH